MKASPHWRARRSSRRTSDRCAFKLVACQAESLEGRRLLSLGGNQLFPSDNPWNHPITDAPVAANSATLVSSIGAGKPLHPDFGTTYGGLLNGIPYSVVNGSQPKVNVTIDAYPSESDLLPVPIPANAVIEGDPPAGVAAFSQVPSFVQVSLSSQYAYCWSPSTNDVRALQDPTTAGNRFASSWYSSSNFTVDLDFTDGQAHRVAFYMVDFDDSARTQTLDVIDPASSKTLVEQKIASFSGGEYLVFDLTGNVELKFTNTNSSTNAVLSGIFFGAPGSRAIPGSTAASASFVTADTTTQGGWQGVYGGSGFDMPFPQGEGDRHLIVYDSTNNVDYELFNVHRPSEEPDGQWHADSEAVWNMSQDSFRTPGFTSADAAGLPILTGLVRPDETLTQGVINHALRFTVAKSDAAYVFPASHEAGVNNPALPRMGERFRLDPSFNISAFPAADQVILQALKTYGMIVADNGSPWYISGSPAGQWSDDQLHNLTQVIGSDFQAVDLTPVLSGISQSSGPAGGGNTVTISGVNFQGVAGRLQVSFGGVAATNVQVLSDNTLTATVPAAAAGTKVDVTITTPYGTSATSPADQYTYTASAPAPTLVGSPVINGDNPNALFNAAGQPSAGVQRSMVEDVVYTFSESVTISNANAAFTVMGAGPNPGTAPTNLTATAVPGSNGTQWEVTLTGAAAGMLGSIANGEYSITINPSAVFAAGDGTTDLAAGRTDRFYRLFGDINGAEAVTAADNLQLKKALTAYNPAFDSNADGAVTAADNLAFKKDLTVAYFGDGFVPTI